MSPHTKAPRRPHRNSAITRTRHLSAALSLALGAGALAHVDAIRAAPPVTNCADSGSGSLRASVAAAVDGDTVDLSQLACGTITLTSGAIAVTQNSLRIDGPGADALTIDGDFNDRVFRHTGTGTLELHDLALSKGKYVSDTTPYGGCVSSTGSVQLDNDTISDCIVVGQDTAVARGGGIHVAGSLTLNSSTISGNTAQGLNNGGPPYNVALGGGVSVFGDFIAKYSTISDNQAVASDDGHNSSGGGVIGFSYFGLISSTVSGNSAVGMGAALIEGSNTDNVYIVNSTISDNTAENFSGIYTQTPTTIVSSTIAFNRATAGRGALYSQTVPIELQSTIIAGNEGPASLPDDLNGTDATVVSGGNNLITSFTIPVPIDTIEDCPHLNPLADNGGPTRTLALRADSLAIDHGNNDHDLDFDQRGMPRVIGAAADIGAYERNGPDEHLLFSGFEGVCDR